MSSVNIYRDIICNEAVNLKPEQKKEILRRLKRHDPSKIKAFSDGTRIRLESIPNEVIIDIYKLMKHHLNLPDINN